MSKQILIVGGGVIGLCSAYYAAHRGYRVSVIDRNPESRDGCSFGNAGMVVPSHFVPLAAPGMVAMGLKWMWNPESPFYIKPRLNWELFRWGWKFWQASTQARVDKASPLLRDLSFASRACFEELASQANNDFHFTEHGLLMLCKTQRTLDEEATFAERANRLGVPAVVLDAHQTALQDTNVTMDVAGSVYFPKDCHLSPKRFMERLWSQCRSMGVQFQWQTEFLDWVHASGRIACVKTTAGEFEADEVVLCGGAWTDPIAKLIGLKLPMQAGKGYSLTLQKPRQLPSVCSILTEARVAVTPMGDTLRFGGTMEIAGLNEQINPRRVQGIIKSIPNYYPEFKIEDFRGIEPWQGLRPCSPDGLPYIGRTSKFKNLVVATGHAMMGISLGPITGRLVASILSSEPTSIPIDLLSPDRYA
jgi:D-amino-acid dehydrogenase